MVKYDKFCNMLLLHVIKKMEIHEYAELKIEEVAVLSEQLSTELLFWMYRNILKKSSFIPEENRSS